MSDGAHAGISAGRALKTILGGEPAPEESESMTPAAMRTYLESGHADDDYSEASRELGGQILAYLDRHPEHATLPTDDKWEFPPNATSAAEGRVTQKGLYTLAHEAGFVGEDQGYTGFMVGWAGNAAKYAIGAPPSPNPALLEVNL